MSPSPSEDAVNVKPPSPNDKVENVCSFDFTLLMRLRDVFIYRYSPKILEVYEPNKIESQSSCS
jgi:hypothetical protein